MPSKHGIVITLFTLLLIALSFALREQMQWFFFMSQHAADIFSWFLSLLFIVGGFLVGIARINKHNQMLAEKIAAQAAAQQRLKKEKQAAEKASNEFKEKLTICKHEYKTLDRSHKELSEENARLKAELSPLKEAEQKRQQFSRDLDSAWFVPRETPPV